MINLEDVGKTIKFEPDDFSAKVAMVIKAPRGIMVLFDYVPHRQWRKPTNKFCNNQANAIRAFMKEHNNEAVCI